MQAFWEAIKHAWNTEGDLLGKLLLSLGLLLVVLALRMITLRIVRKRFADEPKSLFIWKKNLSYLFAGLALTVLLGFWLSNLGSISTYLGLVSAALVFAMQDPIANLAGWVFLIWRKPFEVGQRIEVNKVRGDVIDIRPFQFSLLELGGWVDADQSTGRIIHVPNAWVFKYEVFSYDGQFDFIWNEIPVLVTFESDWEKAKTLLEAIVQKLAVAPDEAAQAKIQRASDKYLIHFRVLTPIVYTSTKDSGVLLTLRYLVECRQRRTSTANIWEAILREFAKHKTIDFAYPTVRHYSEKTEGKQFDPKQPDPQPPAP